MSIEPLLQAEPVIRVHAFAAIAAFLLGAIQLAAPKGTLPHCIVGWTWVGLIAPAERGSHRPDCRIRICRPRRRRRLGTSHFR